MYLEQEEDERILGLEMVSQVLDGLTLEVNSEATWVPVLLPLEVWTVISFHFG